MKSQSQTLRDNFGDMIRRVQESNFPNDQKQYLVEMLQDQLQIELQCLEMLK